MLSLWNGRKEIKAEVEKKEGEKNNTIAIVAGYGLWPCLAWAKLAAVIHGESRARSCEFYLLVGSRVHVFARLAG